MKLWKRTPSPTSSWTPHWKNDTNRTGGSHQLPAARPTPQQTATKTAGRFWRKFGRSLGGSRPHGRWVFPTPSEFPGLDETSPYCQHIAWHSICEAIDVGEAGVSKTYSCWGSKIQSSWKMSIPHISIGVILPFHANLPDTYQASKGRIESHQRCSKKTQREQTKENGFHGIRIRLCGRGV